MIETVRDPGTGQSYRLDAARPLATGGEAVVYNVPDHPGLVAKIYNPPRPERATKLEFMLANPPKNPTAAQNHPAYAWPSALLTTTTSSAIVGFLMPRITGMKEVFTFYNPGSRRRTLPKFDYRYLMQTARNIAGVMAELHSRGYLIADVSQKNILVSDAALVTVLDTDSFEFRDPKTNVLHLCSVRTPGFIAPEGYHAAPKDPRAVEEDRFALAVMVFHLLMEGVHPFACKYSGQGEAPRLQQNVVAGRFPYKLSSSPVYQPMPIAPPFGMLPAEIQSLFIRCFVTGHQAPAERPTAKEWQKALTDASKNLTPCTKSKYHYYGNHLGAECPWCARIARGFPDPFPEKMEPVKPPPVAAPRPRVEAAPAPASAPQKPASAAASPSPLKALLFIALAIGILLLLVGVFG
jgi:DNA-binding helix-hairpin-helix protein with protein kinase domain